MSEISHSPAQYPYRSQLPIVEKLCRMLPKSLVGSFSSYTEPGFSLAATLQARQGPFLEIGGPSRNGYYHLHKLRLPKRVLISNVPVDMEVHDCTGRFGVEHNDLEIDGTAIDLPEDSLGMVLASALPWTNSHSEIQLERAYSASRRAVEQGELTPDLIDDSLRLKIGQEVFRKLEPDGLYVVDGYEDDIAAHALMGFQTKASLVWHGRGVESGYRYSVLQKPSQVE